MKNEMRDMLSQLFTPTIRSIITEQMEAVQLTLEQKFSEVFVSVDDELVTKQQAAQIRKCSVATIDNLRRAGRLIPINPGAREKRLFKKVDVLTA